MKNEENLGESLKIPWERETQLGFEDNEEEGSQIP
jgi:hypothetical protein